MAKKDKNIVNLLSAIHVNNPQPELRLYYDSTGSVITYTCEKLDGRYVVVTPEVYSQARMDIKVVDGVIVYPAAKLIIGKLVKKISSTTKTSKYDINILTDSDCNYWSYEQREINQ